jgi:hydroxyethylthiazole kinase
MVRENAPLVHNITNYVAMNFSANVLLALGASPLMAHAEEELEEIVSISPVLALNIGTLSAPWVKSMHKALDAARRREKLVVLDPVGVGASKFRTQTALELLAAGGISVIRGNASEIRALAGADGRTKGVDSSESSDSAVAVAQRLSHTYNTVVCVTGATDYVVHAEGITALKNGHPWMTKVTAMGCAATSMVGAFLAVEADRALAAVSAIATITIAGEIAAAKSGGPGSFQVNFLDTLANLTETQIAERLKVEHWK